MNLMKYDWLESYQKMSFEAAPLSFNIINIAGGTKRKREILEREISGKMDAGEGREKGGTEEERLQISFVNSSAFSSSRVSTSSSSSPEKR